MNIPDFLDRRNQMWKNKKNTFAVKVENWIGKKGDGYHQIALLPSVTIFWTTDGFKTTFSINIGLFIAEFQFWFGDVGELE